MRWLWENNFKNKIKKLLTIFETCVKLKKLHMRKKQQGHWQLNNKTIPKIQREFQNEQVERLNQNSKKREDNS